MTSISVIKVSARANPSTFPLLSLDDTGARELEFETPGWDSMLIFMADAEEDRHFVLLNSGTYYEVSEQEAVSVLVAFGYGPDSEEWGEGDEDIVEWLTDYITEDEDGE